MKAGLNQSRWRSIAALILTVGGFMVIPLANAQQEPKWNQYMFNDFYFNPGVAGSRQAISTLLASRYQWVNIPENASPRTTCFSIHAPVEFLRGGLGLLVIQDQEFFNKSTNVRLNYAFRIPFQTFSIGLGVYGGMIQTSLDGTKFRPENPNDPLLVSTNVQANAFDIGTGINFQSSRWFVNFAVNRLNQPKLQFNNTGSNLTYARNFFASTGYQIPLNKYWRLTPSILYKSNSFVSQIDYNLMLSIGTRVWVGGGYSQGDGIVGLLGYRMRNGVRFGYSYTEHLGDLGGLANGSHEVFLGYDFTIKIPPPPQKKILTPRYF
ncbi:MAG: type IX secretion system membrane protein PorP/SprF [Sphingomonadales bacterium]|nr:type IX secretion system membrane protein PorP/SprF [Sphingomonadales bacterium]